MLLLNFVLRMFQKIGSFHLSHGYCFPPMAFKVFYVSALINFRGMKKTSYSMKSITDFTKQEAAGFCSAEINDSVPANWQ